MERDNTEIKKMKVYLLKRLVKMQKEINEALETCKVEIKRDDVLTVKQVLDEFNISRSTFDRWRARGLKIYQDKPKSAIRVKRVDVFKFIN